MSHFAGVLCKRRSFLYDFIFSRIMSHSPSYSPVLDIVDPRNLENVIEDSADPVINPFYYAQDRETWEMAEATKAYEESRQQKTVERRLKKKKSKSFKNSSYIMRKEQGRVHHLIKIMVYDLDGCNIEEIDTETDNASVNVQYIVTSDYDDIMDKTDNLVSKIVQKLSKSNV